MLYFFKLNLDGNMEKEILAVIWDMGGVLLRSEDKEPRQRLAEKYKISLDQLYDLVFNSESAKLAGVGKITEDGHWNAVAKSLGLNSSELDSFKAQFWEGDRLDDKLVGFIHSLMPTYRTALLSNAWSGARNVLTHTRPCMDSFHQSIFSYEVGLAKPDPEIYNLILQRLDVKPMQAIFVDDMVENIQAANQIGIHGVQFLNTQQAINAVKKLLDK
jgi:glucose-1-phosphatase